MSNYSNRYSFEFQIDAIKLVKENNRSILSTTKDLGINPQTLRNWLAEMHSLNRQWQYLKKLQR